MIHENNYFIIYLQEITSLKFKLSFNELFLKQINFFIYEMNDNNNFNKFELKIHATTHENNDIFDMTIFLHFL
jgi:hypothetical protein